MLLTVLEPGLATLYPLSLQVRQKLNAASKRLYSLTLRSPADLLAGKLPFHSMWYNLEPSAAEQGESRRHCGELKDSAPFTTLGVVASSVAAMQPEGVS